jgi:hypothetical protein
MQLPHFIAPRLAKLTAFDEFGDGLWFRLGNRNKERI